MPSGMQIKRLADWGYNSQAFKKAIRQAETFFKHAVDDPHDVLNLSGRETECVLWSAIECYHRLASDKSKLLSLFIGFFALQNPDSLSEAARDELRGLIPLG